MPSAINVKVEIAFATQPYAVTPTWTDVTSKVAWDQAPIQINRGRSDELTSITATQLSLTLDNSDGRFTAGYASGANFPNVKLGKRIRVSVNPGAGFLEIFDGFVDSWPVYWPAAGLLAYAPITASDRLKKLGKQIAPDTLLSQYISADGPSDWWPFDDPDGTAFPRNRTGTTGLTQTLTGALSAQTITFGQSGLPYEGTTAVLINNASFGVQHVGATIDCAVGWSVECFFQLTPQINTNFISFWDPGFTNTIALTLGSGGLGTSIFVLSGSINLTVTDPAARDLTDSQWHHVAATLSGTTLSLYIDGVLSASSSTGAISGTTPVGLQYMLVIGSVDGEQGSVSNAAVYQSALNATQIANHAGAGLNGFSGETSLARATRLGTLVSIVPSIVVTGTSGTVTMAPLAGINGTDYLSLLQAVADTESGLLFTQRTGEVRLRPRRDMQNPASKWTIAAGHYLTDLQPLLDDFEIVNDAIGDRPGGNSQHLTDTTSAHSVGEQGVYSVSKTLQTTDDNEVLSWAQWQISSPSFGQRFPQVSVDLMTHQSEIATWLTVELGDRITLSGLPSASAPATSVDLLLQGYSETLSKDTYTVRMNTSPLPPNVWILGDAVLGALGVTTLLAY